MKKRLVSLLIVSCVLVSLCVPVLASSVTYPSSPNVTTNNGTMDVSLRGVTKYNNISVTVPTYIPFVIDPSETSGVYGDGDITTSQVTQPDITIKNYSSCNVFVGVCSVTTTNVTLVNSFDELVSTQKSIFFDLWMPQGSTELNPDSTPSYDYLNDGVTGNNGVTLYDLVGIESPYSTIYPLGVDGLIAAAKDSSTPTTNKVTICALAEPSNWTADSAFIIKTCFVVSSTPGFETPVS